MRGLCWSIVVFCLGICRADELTLIVPNDVLHDYELLLNNRSAHQLHDFSGTGSRRDTVEMIIVQQALWQGGITEPVKFVTADSYSRILRMLETGEALLGATSVWENSTQSVKDSVALTDSVIPDGQFVAGFYTSADNQRALNADSLAKIQQLQIVANPAWSADWSTLQTLGIRRLEATPQWNSMVRMVLAHRVDALLAPFQNRPDLTLHTDFGTLHPIPNIKVALRGSRHFPVSLKHPRGLIVLTVLNQTLRKMHRDGTIQRAYSQSGFYNARVKEWKLIN